MIGRRDFLGAALIVASAWRLQVPIGPAGTADAEDLTSALTRFFSDRESAAALGRKYLEAVPGERSAGTLTSRIAATLSDTRGESLATLLSHRADVIVDRHTQDFFDERVVRLDGWVLSATEARLYALCALT